MTNKGTSHRTNRRKAVQERQLNSHTYNKERKKKYSLMAGLNPDETRDYDTIRRLLSSHVARTELDRLNMPFPNLPETPTRNDYHHAAEIRSSLLERGIRIEDPYFGNGMQ